IRCPILILVQTDSNEDWEEGHRAKEDYRDSRVNWLGRRPRKRTSGVAGKYSGRYFSYASNCKEDQTDLRPFFSIDIFQKTEAEYQYQQARYDKISIHDERIRTGA